MQKMERTRKIRESTVNPLTPPTDYVLLQEIGERARQNNVT